MTIGKRRRRIPASVFNILKARTIKPHAALEDLGFCVKGKKTTFVKN